MTVIVTTNEPKKIRELFDDRVEVPMGFDFKLYTDAGTVGIERKKVPGDLLSSVTDGRLGREILAMREECQFIVILLHGTITYRTDGTVKIGGNRYRGREWTRKGMRNLLRTLQYVEGCYLEYARNNQELVEVVTDLQEYFDKSHHNSLHTRPGIHTDWLVPTGQERVRYWMQGLPGISVVRAKLLCDRFSTPLALFEASIDEICEIRGMGKNTATKIYSFLRGQNDT